jgi:multiple sugar transport system substrate-binding protein
MGGINRLENHVAKIKQLASHGGFFLFLFIIFSGVATSSLAEQLNIGFSISTSAQRETFYTLAREFERHHPGVTVRFTTLSSEEYKRSFPSMVSADSNLDVLYWHSGQRLFDYVDEGLVLSIDDVWERQDLEAVFDQSVKNTLIRDGQYYGVPISYYQIGFYYSKNIFNHLSLTEPSSWQDLMAVCEAIKQAGYPPIFIGTKSNWPATAWFDYLNLRINGLDFHQQLTRGEIPFTDERVVSVFNTLLEPIEKGYFISDHNELLWREGLPFLFRDLVGMSMIGNYVIQDIQQTMVPRLGFFPFPILDERVAPYEEAPIDVLIIPKQASNVSLAKQFLAFSARHEVQSSLNKSLGVLSPHKLAQQDTSPLTKEAYDVLSNAAGVSHFFDRDAIEIFANGVMPVLDKFMREPDVDSTVRELEKIRKTTFVTH